MNAPDVARTVWRKSSYSNGAQANCVEVTFTSGVAVRDSKNISGPVLVFPKAAWSEFLAH